MGWHAALHLQYDLALGRTRGHATHSGPLRVLKALYPEGEAVCHHVLVHPPAGLVGGDVLELDLTLAPGSHAVLTTPGATRFYRSAGDEAVQRVSARLAAGARLEWLPQETIVTSGARAASRQCFELAPGAEMIGWDVFALGLPASGAPFKAGYWRQRIELAGLWLESAKIDAQDRALLDSPYGMAGHSAMATMWCAWGAAPPAALVDELLDVARQGSDGSHAALPCAVTRTHPQVVVLRALADRTEPLLERLKAVRRQWRSVLWNRPAIEPRIWST